MSLRTWSGILGGIGIVMYFQIGSRVAETDPSVILGAKIASLSLILASIIIEIYSWRQRKKESKSDSE